MKVKVVWQTGVWIDGEKRAPWSEVNVDEATARLLESQRMVVILEEAPKGPGRPRKEV